MKLKPQTKNVLSFLKSGREINASQAEGLFGIKNLAARVHELREQGYAVYTNYKDGKKAAYRIGSPSKDMVRAAYAIAGSAVFQ